MKIGLIFECAPKGPDALIGEYVVRQVIADAEPVSSTMVNKDILIRECGVEARRHIEGGCKIIFIIWDLAPAWPDRRKPRCRHEDKEGIYASLTAAQVPHKRVVLVCVEQMLESWLIADGQAITQHLKNLNHPKPAIKDVRHPDREKDPKARVMLEFSNAGRAYNEHVDALPIFMRARKAKLRRSDSYARLEDKLLIHCPTAPQPSRRGVGSQTK